MTGLEAGALVDLGGRARLRANLFWMGPRPHGGQRDRSPWSRA